VRIDGDVRVPVIDARYLVARSMNGDNMKCATTIRRLAQSLHNNHRHDAGIHDLEDMIARYQPAPTTTGTTSSGSTSNRHVHGMRRKGNNGHKRHKPRSTPSSFAHVPR